MPRFKVNLTIGLANAEQIDEIEIPDDELEGLDGDAREEAVHEVWKEWAWNYIDGCAEEIE